MQDNQGTLYKKEEKHICKSNPFLKILQTVEKLLVVLSRGTKTIYEHILLLR